MTRAPGGRPRRRSAAARNAELGARALKQLKAGDFAGAAKTAERGLRHGPRDARLAHLAGFARLNAGDADRARRHLEAAAAMQPNDGQVFNSLGVALDRLGQHGEAIRAYERALALLGRQPGLLGNYGAALRAAGRAEAAIAALREAVALDPKAAGLHNNLGNALVAIGDFPAAETAFRRAVALRPDFAEAHRHLAILRGDRDKATDREIDEMERILAEPKRGDSDRINLHFALASAYDGRADLARAFDHWRLGNALKRRGIAFDPDRLDRDFADLAEVFSRDRLAGHAGSGMAGEKPVFVVGMPRSGTTLVEQILASHPKVHGAGELALLPAIVAERESRSGRLARWIAAASPAEIAAVGRDYLSGIAELAPDSRFVTDKLPQNFQYVGLILLAMPDARIVHCRRDPIDTCFSCFRHLFSGRAEFAYDLHDLARYHRAYEKLMRHWHGVAGDRIVSVAYEALVTSPEPEIRRLLSALGLPFDPACLDFHKTRRAVNTASATQVRRPIYRSSIGAWRRYRGELAPLIEALGVEPDA